MTRRDETPLRLFCSLLLSVGVGATACDAPSESGGPSPDTRTATGDSPEPSSDRADDSATAPTAAGSEDESAAPSREAVQPQKSESADEAEPSTATRPKPRRLAVGAEIDEAIAAPGELTTTDLRFETDWYALEARAGQTVVITVEPTPPSQLRPMITVLLPDPDGDGEWREVDARRSTEDGARLQLKVRFDEAGTKLITVDDTRNLPRIGQTGAPDAFHGGSNYGYQLSIKRPKSKRP